MLERITNVDATGSVRVKNRIAMVVAVTLLFEGTINMGAAQPKPENAPSNLAITGRYVLPAAVFDCLERTKPGAGNEIQLTDALRILAKEQGLWAYIYEGVSYDAGDKLGFLKATVEIALQNPEFGAAFRTYLKGLKL